MISAKNQEHDDGQPPAEILNRLAEAVRSACIEAALQGYEEGRMSGLCHEGACENAIGAIQMVDVTQIIARLKPHDGMVPSIRQSH